MGRKNEGSEKQSSKEVSAQSDSGDPRDISNQESGASKQDQTDGQADSEEAAHSALVEAHQAQNSQSEPNRGEEPRKTGKANDTTNGHLASSESKGSRLSRFPMWIHNLGAWRLFVAVIALALSITALVLTCSNYVSNRVSIRANIIVPVNSGFTNGVSWPVIIGVTNDGPAEGRNVSAHLQVAQPWRIRHASPIITNNPAGTKVEISAHGHGDQYIINFKDLVPHTPFSMMIEFRAENEKTKKELLDSFNRDMFSGVFAAEFIKQLYFVGENVESEIIVGMLEPVSEWNGFEVQKNAEK